MNAAPAGGYQKLDATDATRFLQREQNRAECVDQGRMTLHEPQSAGELELHTGAPAAAIAYVARMDSMKSMSIQPSLDAGSRD